MARVRIGKVAAPAAKGTAATRAKGAGNYFVDDEKDVQFIPSGCKLLDLALGGGWADGRIANIVGDKAVGKTLLCIEACANFIRVHPKGKLFYREAEAAFDKGYAKALGMPVSRIDFGQPLETVEDMFEDLQQVLRTLKGPGLYIVDSLDALTDRAELKRDLDEGSYGANKAKQLSQLFRRLVRKMERKQLTIIIVSQVRDKIGAMFGRKTTRSGGKALDFYASQVVYLANLGVEYATLHGTKRATGVNVRAKLDKNKVGLPFRECDFTIIFGYGIDDLRAGVAYLKLTKALQNAGINKGVDPKKYADEYRREHLGTTKYKERQRRVNEALVERWAEMERSLMPSHQKYA
jgi:recombination protein RecA